MHCLGRSHLEEVRKMFRQIMLLYATFCEHVTSESEGRTKMVKLVEKISASKLW